MPINNSYNEDAIVEAIATALDNFYTNLIKKVDSRYETQKPVSVPGKGNERSRPNY